VPPLLLGGDCLGHQKRPREDAAKDDDDDTSAATAGSVEGPETGGEYQAACFASIATAIMTVHITTFAV